MFIIISDLRSVISYTCSLFLVKKPHWLCNGQMYTSSVVDHGLEPRTGQTMYLLLLCSAWNIKQSEQRLVSSQVSEQKDMLFLWASTLKVQLSVLVYYKSDIITSLNVTCSGHEKQLKKSSFGIKQGLKNCTP